MLLIDCRTGFAVWPTWLAVRDHIPVETEKDKVGTRRASSAGDEEEALDVTVVAPKEVEKLAVGQTAVGRSSSV